MEWFCGRRPQFKEGKRLIYFCRPFDTETTVCVIELVCLEGEVMCVDLTGGHELFGNKWEKIWAVKNFNAEEPEDFPKDFEFMGPVYECDLSEDPFKQTKRWY